MPDRGPDRNDQDSVNAAAGGNLLEKSPQDALTIIENKLKVRNSRSKLIASPVNACDNHSSSELAKLTHAVNQQTNAVPPAMTAMLKQFQSNPPPVQVKAVEEIRVTCGGAHPYYQCLAAGGNTFPEYQNNIQGYVSATAGNYNQGNPGYHPQEETYTDPDHVEYTIKVPPPPPVQKPKPPIQRHFVLHTRDSLPPHIPYPSRLVLKVVLLCLTKRTMCHGRLVFSGTRDVNVTETFHEQTDDELSEKELKQIEADDQAIQTILLGLLEDIYAAVDSCETAQEIWLRVQQMMKGSDIGIQEKKATLFNEWEMFTSNEGESIESYYHHFLNTSSRSITTKSEFLATTNNKS
nr:UBN2 domain-containing protein [Tanacetum cinerariifolium]